MFFIPLFGAAVSGSKHAAPVWQQAIVLLLGPLPGIVLGLILQLTLRPGIDSWQEMTVMCLILLNASNLLPVVPLDGGRLLDILLFARKPYLTVAFRVFAIGALGWMGWQSGSWILLVVAGLMLIGTPLRYRQAKLERAFRNNPLELPDQLESLTDTQRRDLFGWAALLKPLDRTPTTLVADMRTLHENMVSRRPGILTWMLLIGIYLAGFALSAATLMLAMDNKKVQREHQAQELVEGFHTAAADLGEWRKQQAAAKDPATKDHLQEQIDGRWKELLTAWEKKSREVHLLALSRLITQGKADPAYVPDILRLNVELNKQNAAQEAK